jgi:hypothetical protein
MRNASDNAFPSRKLRPAHSQRDSPILHPL